MNRLLVLVLLICGTISCKNDKNKLMTLSGYEYTVDNTNASEKQAQIGDFVTFAYKIVGSNDEVLDNFEDASNMPSVKVPDLSDPKNGAYKNNPVMEVLSKAVLGAKYTIVMPIDSMQARERNPKLDSMTHVNYVLDIKEIMTEEEKKEEDRIKMEEGLKKSAEKESRLAEILADYKAGKLDVKTTDTGLEYIIFEEGSGPLAKEGDYVSVDYFGVLESNGSRFDDSFSRGRPYSFPLGKGQVIKGWDEGIGYLNKGAKATLFIPYDLAYGQVERPGIPSKSDLVFYVELQDIKN